MNKNLLGRKIIDLIEENRVQLSESEEIVELDIKTIHSNPDQPRVTFDKTALKQLAESIKQHGVIQPILVKPTANGFLLVAGERRLRASLIAGKKTIPAIVRDYNSIYLTELAILENIQREDLTPIEEAIAYERVLKTLGLTQAELAKKIGKSRSYVTNVVGLLQLPDSVIESVNKGLISMGHAKVLSKISDDDLVINLTRRIIEEQLTVRKLEDLIKKRNNRRIVRNNTINRENLIIQNEIETYFEQAVGEKISVNITKNEIKIRIKNDKLLNNIYKLIVRKED